MDYDFVEIGSADFDTITEEVSGNDTRVGLEIEPLSHLLDKIPERPFIRKVNCAISDKDGELDLYYIPEHTKIAKRFRGCNSLNEPHKLIKKLCDNVKDVMAVKKVPVKSFKTLAEEYNIKTIKRLKVDAEGHDVIILDAYFRYCLEHPDCFADLIEFEAIEFMIDEGKIYQLISNFSKLGYRIKFRDDENIHLERRHKRTVDMFEEIVSDGQKKITFSIKRTNEEISADISW